MSDTIADMPTDCAVLPWADASRVAWQAAFDAAPEGHPLADPRWFDVIGRVWGVRRHVVVAPGRAGVLPVYEVRSIGGARHIFSPKHGLIARDTGTAKALLEALGDHARSRRAHGVSVTSGWIDHAVPVAGRTRTAQELALPADADTFWAGLRDKVRNTIRKAERAGIAVDRDPAHIDAFWRLQADAMAARGLPVKPRGFFRDIAATFAADMTLYTALSDGQTAGGMLVLRGRGTALYAFGAYDPVARDAGAASLLAWHAARDLIAAGFSRFDLGESTKGGGTWRFKAGLGASDRSVHYYDPLRPADAAQDVARPGHAAAEPSRPGRLRRALLTLPEPLRRPALTALSGHGRLL
ncbi:MAG: lipid II:glycine glycyltransferase FemX [Alphaproteobacteria bacterium]